jgi:hypothetical protein
MTQTITIEMDDTNYKALEYVAIPNAWAKNFIDVRAQKAKKEILDLLIAHCNANEIALAVGEAAQVQQAYDLGIVETAAIRAANQQDEAVPE